MAYPWPADRHRSINGDRGYVVVHPGRRRRHDTPDGRDGAVTDDGEVAAQIVLPLQVGLKIDGR